MNFTATGPRGSGSVMARARKTGSGWRLILLRLTPAGQSGSIDLLTEQRAALDPPPPDARSRSAIRR